MNKIKEIPMDSDIEIEIPDEDLEKWIAVYGDDLTIL